MLREIKEVNVGCKKADAMLTTSCLLLIKNGDYGDPVVGDGGILKVWIGNLASRMRHECTMF